MSDWWMGQLAMQDAYNPNADFPDTFAQRFPAADWTIGDVAAPADQDAFAAAAQRTARPYQAAQQRAGTSNLPAVAEELWPKEPWQYGLMFGAPGASLAGKAVAQLPRAVRAGAAATGFLLGGELPFGLGSTNKAEGGWKDPMWWHGISANKLVRPMSELFSEHTPTQVIQERFISPEALQGGVLLPAPGDRAMAGERLIGLGGQKLDKPVELQGGHGFMPANTGQGVVWASEQGPITSMADRVRKLADQYGKVYVPYTAMGEQSVDFSHHMSDTLSEMLKDAKVLKR